MKPAEGASQYDRHDHNASPQDHHVSRAAQIEPANPTDEQVTNRQVEQAP
jgi:hypothetical protein